MNVLKYLKWFSILFLFVSLLSSCSDDSDLLEESEETINLVDPDGSEEDSSLGDPDDDDEDDEDSDEDDEEDSNDELDFLDCFELVYPVSFVLPDGTQITVNDDNELETELELYYENNPEEEEMPVPVFPISVILEDDSQVIISNIEELEALLITCEDEDDEDDGEDFHEDCFEVVFPVSFILPDGTEHTSADEDEAEMILDAFYLANPDVDEEPEFIYPIEIRYEDGVIETINSEAELDLAEDNC